MAQVARASLLLLPTAVSTQLAPLLRQVPGDAVASLLPDALLGRIVHARHAAQRRRMA